MRFYLLLLPLLFVISCTQNKKTKSNLPLNEVHFNSFFYPEKSIDAKRYQALLQNAKQFRGRMAKPEGFASNWEVQGPGNIGARINTVCVHPTDTNTIYAGFAGGGLWKTENGGETWESIFDDIPVLAISDIVLDPQNPEIVYVATGDANISSYFYFGNGLYKSLNGGKTWENIGLSDMVILSKIIIHPTNSDIIYVSSMGDPTLANSNRGLYKTIDGGKTWKQIFYLEDDLGVPDFEIHPDDPNVIFIATWHRLRSLKDNYTIGTKSGIYKSTDAGDSWTRCLNGLPSDTILTSRVGVTIAPSNPNHIYSVIMNEENSINGIYESLDQGDTWNIMPFFDENKYLGEYVVYDFGWYFGKIRVNPKDEFEPYLLGVDLWKKKRNNDFWEIATPNWWEYSVHADKHDLLFSQGNAYLATDGGLYKTDNINNPNNWLDIENIPTTQFYRTSFNPHEPNLYWGGAQDNGTTAGNNSNINSWERISGGDGFRSRFIKSSPYPYFVSSQFGSIYKIDDSDGLISYFSSGLPGINFPWDMEYLIRPFNQNEILAATDRLCVKEIDGDKWREITAVLTPSDDEYSYNIISALDESELQEDLIYAGTGQGKVFRVEDGVTTDISTGLPKRYISSISHSPSFEDWVYVTVSGYKAPDFDAHIFKSEDKGETWISIGADLPDIPLNDVFIYPNSEDSILFVGGENGVYGSINGGNNWHRLGANMPYLRINDFAFNPVHNELVVATFGRGLMSYVLDSIATIDQPVQTEERVVIKNDLLISPNPASDYISVTFNNTENRNPEIIVLDINGKVVFQQKLSNSIGKKTVRIDISSISPGQYFVKTKIRHQILTESFMKIGRN